MSVVVCACGKRLKAPEHAAGKLLRCPGCGETVRVPADEDNPAAAEPEKIRMTCSECERTLAVRSEYAGKSISCPGCKAAIRVPARDETPRRERVRADRSGAASRGDEDERDESRPRRKKKAGGRSLLPFVLVGVLALVLVGGGGAFAVWYFWGRTTTDLALVPADAQGFVSLRVADASKQDVMKKGLNQLKGAGQEDVVAKLRDDVGLKLDEIERVTLVYPDAAGQGAYAIVLTTKNYDRDALKAKLSGSTDLTYEGKKYHVGRFGSAPPAGRPMGGPMGGGRPQPPTRPEAAIYFAGPRVVVYGDEAGVKRCIGVQVRKSNTGPLDASIKQAGSSKRHVFVAYLPSVEMTTARQGLQGQWAEYQPLLNFRALTVETDLSDSAQVDVRLRYSDESQARTAQTGLQKLKGQATEMLPALEAFGMPPAVTAQLKAVVDSAKITQSGSEVNLSLRVELARALEEVNRLKDQGPPKQRKR